MLHLLRTCYRIRQVFLLAREKLKTRESQIYLLLDVCGFLSLLMTAAPFFFKSWLLLSMLPPVRHSLIFVFLNNMALSLLNFNSSAVSRECLVQLYNIIVHIFPFE